MYMYSVHIQGYMYRATSWYISTYMYRELLDYNACTCTYTGLHVQGYFMVHMYYLHLHVQGYLHVHEHIQGYMYLKVHVLPPLYMYMVT